jgi:predicted MFS family arabinose efflux permease
MATSWALEMEMLILGWYVLAETHSVFMLTLYASLRFIGTLLAPMFGVMGDRIGARNMLSLMRAFYAASAVTLMMLAFTGVLTPVYVLVLATFMGLVVPSDIGMRGALVGETMPRDQLMGAMSIQRTTQDSARIAGALTGASLVATLGMGPAYAVVAGFYAISFVLTLNTAKSRPAGRVSGDAAPVPARVSPWGDLKEGLAYVWNTPHLLAVMCLALLLNATAFPLFISLLPYVAKEIYVADQTTLGYMVAGAAFGSLVGSIVLSRYASAFSPARLMVFGAAAWYALLLVFAQVEIPVTGIVVLMVTGLAHSMGLIPMSAILLRNAEPQFRSRVMGIRMLAIYSNIPGLLLAGPLIATLGYPFTATLYCLLGLAFMLLIVSRWRAHIWRLDAATNVR